MTDAPAAVEAQLAAHRLIREGTYPEVGDQAVALYDALLYEAAHVGEPVDLSGDFGLDVGGYDGLYRSVIRALGVQRIITVEPSCGPLDFGQRHNVLPQSDSFMGTVQQWVAQRSRRAGATFVFNMAGNVAADHDFARSLATATKVGGLVVATFRMAAEASSFMTTAERASCGLRWLYDPGADRQNEPPPRQGANKFIQLYRREAG